MKLKIGTRKSRLAVIQTEMVIHAIKKKYPYCQTEIVYITTTGDIQAEQSLRKIGGKGVFVSEIEKALQEETIDIAVHSAKDLPIYLADGLEISAVLERGNYRDVLVTNKGITVQNRPDFIIGTSSIRRMYGIRNRYPAVGCSEIRGNVDTRLQKLKDRQYDGILLAGAGLERTGSDRLSDFDYTPFDYTEFLPSPCQGIIAVESRKNSPFKAMLESISDKNTFLSFETERYIIRKLDTGCTSPLGAYSFVEGDSIRLFLSEDMQKIKSAKGKVTERFSLVEEVISC